MRRCHTFSFYFSYVTWINVFCMKLEPFPTLQIQYISPTPSLPHCLTHRRALASSNMAESPTIDLAQKAPNISTTNNLHQINRYDREIFRFSSQAQEEPSSSQSVSSCSSIFGQSSNAIPTPSNLKRCKGHNKVNRDNDASIAYAASIMKLVCLSQVSLTSTA